MNQPTGQRRFYLVDLAGLVVGYSLASLLLRAFRPGLGSSYESLAGTVLIGIAFLWLGLAMSGPVLLLGRRKGQAETGEKDKDKVEPRSWSELAWLIIGFYWIGLTIFIVPVRLHDSRILDTVFLGLFPIAAALLLRVFRRKLPLSEPHDQDWTHGAAIGLLLLWPFAWIALILLGKNLP